MTKRSAQAYEKDYELHTLGWKAFQDLCLTTLGEVLGQPLVKFSPTKDGGRDGAFYTSIVPSPERSLTGSLALQCKYTSSPDKLMRLNYLDEEISKANVLAKKGLADNYFLMTNYKVTGPVEDAIRKSFLNIDGIKECAVYGLEWISHQIAENSRLRMLVPRVYGLGDLSNILDERSYEQAQEILSFMKEDISKIVITDAYKRSANALINHNFVLLLGEPASGKTVIASSLALGAIDNWHCETMIIRSPDEFQEHWNPKEPRQLFWVDDAFGATQYQQSLASEWNRVFLHMSTAVHKGTRILFTSRDYIYREALQDLKISSFPLMQESQVIINVQNLSLPEKEQILYNHVKLGNQEKTYRRQIKPYLKSAAQNSRFMPEIARRLGNREFTKDLAINQGSVISFFENPLQFLIDTIRNLNRASFASLALIYMHGGSVLSPITWAEEDMNAINILGASQSEIRKSLGHMAGCFTQLIKQRDTTMWVFRHPTIKDAIASIVGTDPELVDIYLNGTAIDKLMGEVTCGDVKAEGVKVVVPENRFDWFIEELDKIYGAAQKNVYPIEFRVFHFLASRCDKTFLERYVGRHSELYENICDPLPYLGATPHSILVGRLWEFGLLPETWRKRFVEKVKELAVTIPDSDFLIPRIRRIFKESEIHEILAAVEERLLPSLDDEVQNWEDNYSQGESPSGYYEPLIDALKTYSVEFEDRELPTDLIEAGLTAIDRSIEHLDSSYDDKENDVDTDSLYDTEDYEDDTPSDESRDIFDDIDE